MKRRLIELVFGILIGLGNMVPGFSGGTVILILGITESFTGSISNFLKQPLKSLNELWAYILGMVIGIFVATYTIAIGLEYVPLITVSFFLGLVGETVFIIFDEIKNRKMTLTTGISFGLCFGVSIFLCFMEKFGINLSMDNPSIFFMIFLFLLATICGAAMVLPAASGSLILLTLGLYGPMLTKLKDAITALLTFNFDGTLMTFIIVIVFLIGAIVGIFFISKFINYYLKKNDLLIWYGILGLLFSAFFTIYYNAYTKHIAPNPQLFLDNLTINIVLSVVMLLVGFFGLRYITKKNKEKENKVNE